MIRNPGMDETWDLKGAFMDDVSLEYFRGGPGQWKSGMGRRRSQTSVWRGTVRVLPGPGTDFYKDPEVSWEFDHQVHMRRSWPGSSWANVAGAEGVTSQDQPVFGLDLVLVGVGLCHVTNPDFLEWRDVAFVTTSSWPGGGRSGTPCSKTAAETWSQIQIQVQRAGRLWWLNNHWLQISIKH